MGMIVKESLIGKTFGQLRVLSRDYNYQKEHNLKTTKPYWKCLCSCGKEKTVIGQNLTSGRVNSCGCLSRELASKRMIEMNHSSIIDLTNQIFGFLQVIKLVENTSVDRAIWECKCLNCGTIIEVLGSNLRRGATRSCGCISSFGEKEIARLLNEEGIKYKKEYIFPELKDQSYLRFDFAILNEDNSIQFLIEYQGIQHFDKRSSYYSEAVIRHDLQKVDFCKEKKIPLVILRYDEEISHTKIFGKVIKIL